MGKTGKAAIVVVLVVLVVAVIIAKQGGPSRASGTPGVAGPQEKLPCLLDLGSVSCIPCKMMAPMLEELREDYKGKLRVEFIDVREDPDAATKHDIQIIPTQIFFDAGGKELSRHEGYWGREDILAKWKELGFGFADES